MSFEPMKHPGPGQRAFDQSHSGSLRSNKDWDRFGQLRWTGCKATAPPDIPAPS